MKVLYAASEAAPFLKTGGLADVAGSLPKSLKRYGADIRVVLPLYAQIGEPFREKMKRIHEFWVDLDWRHQYAGVYELKHDGVTFYFIDNEQYFHRPSVYGEFDDAERFLFFSKAITMLPKILGFRPDIIHTNDWHTAMVNIFVHEFRKGDDFYDSIRTVYTIHNLKYQGIFDPSVLQMAGLSPYFFSEDSLKFYDRINFMKGGIVYCDALTTVSETYAEEIQYPYFGEQLDGTIRAHRQKLRGIVNGIDYDVWNPKTDPFLVQNYDVDSIEKKIRNKRDLQNLYGLERRDDVPMFGLISRFTEMKGIDLITFIMEEILQEDIQVVVLGTGEHRYEESFHYFAWKYPKKVAARILFSNEESHRIYAGADFFLMPSFAEPCGISQLIAMRYGTLPIVRETGGLKDTVVPFNVHTGEGTGFSFANINAHELIDKVREAIGVYGNPEMHRKLVENAMSRKNDWESSSEKYMELYEKLTEG